MTRVVLTIGRLDYGGAEMRMLETLEELDRDRYDVLMYVVSGKEGQLDAAYRAAGARIHYGKPGLKGLGDFAAMLRTFQPDVVHANASLSAGFYLAVAKRLGVARRYAHIRSIGYNRTGLGMRLRNALYRRITNHFATAVLGVSEGTYQLARTPRSKWITLFDGTRPWDGVRPPASPGTNILFLGRVSYEKNPHKLLDIMEYLHDERGSEARLSIVGYGPLVEEVEAEIAQRGLGERVAYEGKTDRPLERMARADVLLLTSRREGLPGVVLEALATGTPVVSIDVPGSCEIAALVEGVEIVAKDAPLADWADAIERAAARSEDERVRIRESFEASPFLLDAHNRKVEALWTDGLDAARELQGDVR